MKKLLPIFLLALVITSPFIARADWSGGFSCDPTCESPLACDSIAECIKLVIQYAWRIALPVGFVLIFWAGFLFATSGGSEEKITRARKTLVYVIVGLAIVFAAWALATAFQNFFANI